VDFLPVEQELRGKVAFVLGGSSGLGLASAKLLAERGAAVAIFGHAPDTLTIAADLASAGLKIHGAQSKIIHAAIEETVSRFGGLDILVNSAATTQSATWWRPTKPPGTGCWQST
jgi:NAD(P)-dependent dehydrogenase (short-subunit alcohol dehydrogenase family)